MINPIKFNGENMFNIVKYKDNINIFLCNSLKLKSITKTERILELYIIMIFAFYPLYLFKTEIQNTPVKAILFLVFTFITAVTFIILTFKGKIKLRQKLYSLDKWLLAISFLTIIILFYKIINNSYSIQTSYQVEIFILTIIISYFLISYINKIYTYYLDVLLVSALFIYCAVLYQYIGNTGFYKPIELLMGDSQNLTSYLTLIVTISILLYCTSIERKKSLFYFLMSAIGFCILFINDNLISVCIIALLFLLIPIIFVPTAELIKRNMQLFYLFFILNGLVIFIINYTGLIKKELTLDMINSIYVNFFLVVIIICYQKYWQRIPKNIDLNKSIMRRLQKKFIFLLKAVGIFSLVIITIGNNLPKYSSHLGINIFKDFVEKLQFYYYASNGTFFDVLTMYGLIGIFLLIIVCLYMISGLKLNYNKQNQFSVIFLVIAIVFFVQSIFFSQQLITAPLYVILLTFGIAGKECH